MQQTARAMILNCQVDVLSMEQVLVNIEDYIRQQTFAHIITLNAEIAYAAYDNHELRNIINRAHMVTPDGIGIVWAGRMLSYPFQERVTGIDLTREICHRAVVKKWPVYLLGAAPGVAQQAAEKMEYEFPGLHICGLHHGYFQTEEIPAILRDLRAQKPAIALIALGAPRQELFIDRYRQLLGNTVCIGIGGSLDVLAGNKKRAPAWMIRANLEWMYRLFTEPARIKRQSVLPLFMLRVLQYKYRTKKPD